MADMELVAAILTAAVIRSQVGTDEVRAVESYRKILTALRKEPPRQDQGGGGPPDEGALTLPRGEG